MTRRKLGSWLLFLITFGCISAYLVKLNSDLEQTESELAKLRLDVIALKAPSIKQNSTPDNAVGEFRVLDTVPKAPLATANKRSHELEPYPSSSGFRLSQKDSWTPHNVPSLKQEDLDKQGGQGYIPKGFLVDPLVQSASRDDGLNEALAVLEKEVQ